MRHLITMFLLCFALNALGQDVKVLEQDLEQTVVSDLKHVEEKAYRIFSIDPYNETATRYLVASYRDAEHKDSIPALFNKLKRIDPRSPTPYLLSAKYQFRDFSISDTSRIGELKAAIKLDSLNFEAHYLLGISYYALFNQKQTSDFAFKSRNSLIKAIQLDPTALMSLKYLIIQTSIFLQDTNCASIYEHKEMNSSTDSLNIPISGWYYPIASFIELENNWKNDYSFDVFRPVDLAIFRLNWYSRRLQEMKEPLIFNQPDRTNYRFTWLRSFHHPVAIRLEKTANAYFLHWKQASGYEPVKLIVNKSRRLTKRQWDNFIALLQSADFWNMPTRGGSIGFDGSRWVIEGMDNAKYHVVDRWMPGESDYGKCGRFLIRLTDLKVNKDDLY